MSIATKNILTNSIDTILRTIRIIKSTKNHRISGYKTFICKHNGVWQRLDYLGYQTEILSGTKIPPSMCIHVVPTKAHPIPKYINSYAN